MKTRDDPSRRFRLSHAQAEFIAITVEASWRAIRGQANVEKSRWNSRHRNPGASSSSRASSEGSP